VKRFLSLAWLTLVWVTLWETATWANLLGGLLVASVVVYLLPPRDSTTTTGFRPLAAVRLAAHFLWELVKASAFLAWEVVTPRMRVNAAVISVQLTSGLAGTITTVANLVSLTPGTVTLDVDDRTRTLLIHILHLRTVEDARRSVLRFEQLVIDAFPPRRAEALANSTKEGS
jgi:multicomponent Na+:H+ antiporter subunit E